MTIQVTGDGVWWPRPSGADSLGTCVHTRRVTCSGLLTIVPNIVYNSNKLEATQAPPGEAS